MAKPFQLNSPPSTGLRRVSPTYEAPNPRAPSKQFKWAPGIDCNQAPMGDEPLPNLPQAPVVKSFRVR